MTLTPMDYLRAALAQAMAEGMDLREVWAAAEATETVEQFDQAITAIADANKALGQHRTGAVWADGRWITIE